MAKSLGLSIVAEGVETGAQLDFLVSEGCREVQGYYFSKPLDADAATALLQKELPFVALPPQEARVIRTTGR